MSYVEGFVCSVPTANKPAFIEHAKTNAELFKKHGALSVVECWGDEVPQGEVTSFPKAVKCKEDETVVFSWIVWPDKAGRDRGNDKVYEEMSAQGAEMAAMPFDGKRMIYGGFTPLVGL